jgi:hypothetical protein
VYIRYSAIWRPFLRIVYLPEIKGGITQISSATGNDKEPRDSCGP